MMHRRTVAALALATLLGTMAYAATPAELAFHHAPVHYQDTDSSDYPSDYLTAFDFDGDRLSTNNWDNRGNGLWPSTVYYSVVESCTHHFITYAFFHPRDWSDTVFDQEHENDLEGAILAVRKDGSAHGRVEAMITVFHRDFYSYSAANSGYGAGHESVDGTLAFEWHGSVSRVKTAQEAKGHGVKAWPQIRNFTGASNQDGVVYRPTLGAPTAPRSGNDRNVLYRLVDMTQGDSSLWAAALADAQQPDAQRLTFASWGAFKGDQSGGCGSGLKSCSTHAANAPWGWDDHDDGPSYRGDLALDPARLFAHYFRIPAPFSQHYLRNPFLNGLRYAGFHSGHLPAGFPAQLDLDTLYARQVSSCSN